MKSIQILICFEILINTVISNEITNALTIRAKLCPDVTIFYQKEIATLFQVQGKLRACENSEWSFSNSRFIVCDSHVKIISSHTVVFNKSAILRFLNNVHLLKYFPIKVPQDCFDSCNCTYQTGIQISKFSFA